MNENENENVNVNENVNDNGNQKQRIKLQDVMNGEVLTHEWFRRQYALLIMIGALVFLYIFFGFQAQRQQHRLSDLQKEWKTKHFERLTIEAELTERTRQSTMTHNLKDMGSDLKTNQKPVIHVP